MDLSPGTLFFIAFAAMVGSFVYRMIRIGVLKDAIFGARIESTVGEVRSESQGFMNVALKVHALRLENSEKRVGIELVAKTFLSYQMTPITLSVHQAEQLASFLHDAIRTP